jgi:tyrosinase
MMNPENFGRREFIQKSALALTATTLPLMSVRSALGQTVSTRPEWQTFKRTEHYAPLLNAITLMKANTNSSDPNSWSYWVNVHINYCPHNIAYFFAWHRGYLYHFERQLRMVSGDGNLVLPYWEYYTYAQMPSEFTDASSGNPLYVSRVNTNVYQALTLKPFSSKIVNFPRGMSNAFEPTFEDAPHNPVHNIIGNVMATMQSPTDPIFWLHHCNCDRLWVAWVVAGGRRKMPARTDSYWNGSFAYSSTLTMLRRNTYDTTTNLNYNYDNTRMPSALPPSAQRETNIIRVQAAGSIGTPALPPLLSFQQSSARAIGNTNYAVTGVLNVGLEDRSLSVALPVNTQYGRAIEQMAAGNAAAIPGSTTQYRSVQIVLDDLQLTALGQQGGFYYEMYLNLPPAGDTSLPADRYLVGTFGPFEISGATHHDNTARLRYVITPMLAGLSSRQLESLTLSFLRVSGTNHPRGPAIGIGEVRMELSSSALQS